MFVITHNSLAANKHCSVVLSICQQNTIDSLEEICKVMFNLGTDCGPVQCWGGGGRGKLSPLFPQKPPASNDDLRVSTVTCEVVVYDGAGNLEYLILVDSQMIGCCDYCLGAFGRSC